MEEEKAAEEALFGKDSGLLGLTERNKERERQRERKESEMLTHISITMWCQWSVCEVSCCLVTVLQQQRQCLCLYVSSSQWWVSARLSPAAAVSAALKLYCC